MMIRSIAHQIRRLGNVSKSANKVPRSLWGSVGKFSFFFNIMEKNTNNNIYTFNTREFQC